MDGCDTCCSVAVSAAVASAAIWTDLPDKEHYLAISLWSLLGAWSLVALLRAGRHSLQRFWPEVATIVMLLLRVAYTYGFNCE